VSRTDTWSPVHDFGGAMRLIREENQYDVMPSNLINSHKN